MLVFQYGCGQGSPLAKLCNFGGKVLLVGAPFYNIALLHYAECITKVPDKTLVHYKMPIQKQGKREWTDIEEYDTQSVIVNWAGDDYHELIMQEYVMERKINPSFVGSARSFLFDANDLANFASQWMERNFKYYGR